MERNATLNGVAEKVTCIEGDVFAALRELKAAEERFDVVVADIYDRLRIPVRRWFTREQLDSMLGNAGYADVQVSRRVRNNETFRATGVKR